MGTFSSHCCEKDFVGVTTQGIPVCFLVLLLHEVILELGCLEAVHNGLRKGIFPLSSLRVPAEDTGKA